MELDNQELEKTKELNINYKEKIQKEIKQMKKYIKALSEHIDTEKYEYALKVLEDIIKE